MFVYPIGIRSGQHLVLMLKHSEMLYRCIVVFFPNWLSFIHKENRKKKTETYMSILNIPLCIISKFIFPRSQINFLNYWHLLHRMLNSWSSEIVYFMGFLSKFLSSVRLVFTYYVYKDKILLCTYIYLIQLWNLNRNVILKKYYYYK